MPSPETEVANAILASSAELRTFPSVVARLMELTQDDSISMDAIVKVLASDQAIAGRILRVANSPLSGCRTSVSSLEQAAVRLGMRGIRRNALMVAVYDVYDRDIRATGDLRARIWLHNTACACLVQILARIYPVQDEDEAVAGALLHDVGRTMLHRYDPAGYARAVRLHRQTGIGDLEAERMVFGVDHQAVGALLGQRWNLPPVLRQTIGEHHSPVDLTPNGRRGFPAQALVQLADFLTCFVGVEPVAGLPPYALDFDAYAHSGLDITRASEALEELEGALNETLSYFDLAQIDLTTHSSLLAEVERSETWEAACRSVRLLAAERLSGLAELARKISDLPTTITFDDAFVSVVRDALPVLRFVRIVSYALSESSGMLVPVCSVGDSAPPATSLPALPVRGLDDPLASIARGEPARVLRLRPPQPGPTAGLLAQLDSETAAAAAIVGHRGVYGILVADDPARRMPPTEVDVRALAAAAMQAGAYLDQSQRAVEYAREAEELRRQSIRDSETGIYAECFLLDRLEAEFARARRHGRQFALLGACVGLPETSEADRIEALHLAVDAIIPAIRVSDTVAHLGGGVFAAIVLEVDEGAARVPAAAVENALAESGLAGAVRTALVVCPRDAETAEQALTMLRARLAG